MSNLSPKSAFSNEYFGPGNGQGTNTGITPELVREITERVYKLFLRDLKIGRERQQSSLGQNRFVKGGR